MKNSLHLTERDWQALSEYLDGQLSTRDTTRLEKRLSEQSDLRAGLDELRHTRAMLRSVRKQPAPRNFTLSPAMAQQERKPNPLLRFIPALNFASAASALAVIALLFAGLLPGISPAAAPAPEALALEQPPMTRQMVPDSAATPEMIIQWGSPDGLGGGAANAPEMAIGKGGGGGDASGGYAGPGFVIPPQAMTGMAEEPAQAKNIAEPSTDAAAPELMTVPEQPAAAAAPQQPLTGSGPILGAASPEEAHAANDANLASSAPAAAQPPTTAPRWWLAPVVALSVLAFGFALAAQIIRRKARL